MALRECAEKVRGGDGGRTSMGFCNRRPGGQNIQSLEKHVSQVNEIKHLSMYGKMERLGSLKPFLWCAPRLPGARIVCLFILSFLGGTVRVPAAVDSRWRAALVSILCSLRAHRPGGCNVVAWWLQHPWWTDTAGGIVGLRGRGTQHRTTLPPWSVHTQKRKSQRPLLSPL